MSWPNTDKSKGTFWGAMGAIWTFKTLSDQLDPFWLFRESHSEELMDPKQLYLRPYSLTYAYMYEMVPKGAMYTCIWISRGSKMAPQETPIKYGGMAPSREPFWLL